MKTENENDEMKMNEKNEPNENCQTSEEMIDENHSVGT